MSKQVEITFHGMGGILGSAGCVLMPNRTLDGGAAPSHAGHVHGGVDPMAHRTRMVIPTHDLLHLDSKEEWLPDEVIVFGEEELGIWHIDGRTIRLETNEPPRATRVLSKGEPPNAGNGMVGGFDMLSLKEIHPEASLRPDWERVENCARVYLTGGAIRGAGPEQFTDAGTFSGTTVAAYFSWKSNAIERLAIVDGTSRLELSLKDTERAVRLSITNAAVSSGNHFAIMYSLLKSANPPLIQPKQGLGGWMYPAETCKPPVELPEP